MEIKNAYGEKTFAEYDGRSEKLVESQPRLVSKRRQTVRRTKTQFYRQIVDRRAANIYRDVFWSGTWMEIYDQGL